MGMEKKRSCALIEKNRVLNRPGKGAAGGGRK